MTYDRDIKYAHPFIQAMMDSVLTAIQEKLPPGITCKYISIHRTPADQFELFKKGRSFKNGKWIVVDKSKVITGKDGFVNKSRHNYLPATAFDIGLFDSSNHYLADSPHYKHIKEGETFGFDWGGNWKTLVDEPHLEISPVNFFQKDMEKDNGYVWQWYLIKAGSYTGVHDGIFGDQSLKALTATTGETERNLKAWDILFQRFGKIENELQDDNSMQMAELQDGRPMPDGKRPTPLTGGRPRPWPVPTPRPVPPPAKRPHP